jgi:5-methyltetrahydropteroyltriglutamate--homocysteine methyltransferase
MSAAPRIQTTVVGSYPIPDWLVAAPSAQALRDATRVVLATQEAAGIDVVCDGELYRFDINHPESNGMIDYFIAPMAGIRKQLRFDEVVEFSRRADMKFRRLPAGVVEGKLDSGALDLPGACRNARALATKTFKFTLTGPHMIAKTLADKHYGSVQKLTHAIAGVLAEQVRNLDAEIVQVDEANLPGHPEEWKWALSAMNQVLDAVKTTAAVHLCFGNYGGQRPQSGGWDQLMSYLNGLHCDHIVMECAYRPHDELAVFKELRPEIGFGLGVIDVKRTEIETPEEIARAIERAEKLLGAGRVRYIHPDCGLWNLRRNMADGKIRALVAGRDLFDGRAQASRAPSKTVTAKRRAR